MKTPIIWQSLGLICCILLFCVVSCDRRPPSVPAPVESPPPAGPASAKKIPGPPASISKAGTEAPAAVPVIAQTASAADELVQKDPVPSPVVPEAMSLPESTATRPPEKTSIAAPDAKDIVKRSDDLMRGNSAQGTYIMEIQTPSWSRTLELAVYSKNRDKVFIRILSPAKEAGTGTLRIDKEMWNYLPRIEKVIKVPPSMMLQSWMGSDFANDDLVKENSIVDDYMHRIVAEETLQGHATYKIELIPNPGAAVIWGKIDYWIRKGDDVPIRQDFYDERGRLVKRLDYSDIEPLSDRTVPRTWTMTNLLKDDKSTRIYLKDVVYNQPIDDNIFTLPNLKRLK